MKFGGEKKVGLQCIKHISLKTIVWSRVRTGGGVELFDENMSSPIMSRFFFYLNNFFYFGAPDSHFYGVHIVIVSVIFTIFFLSYFSIEIFFAPTHTYFKFSENLGYRR